MTRAKENIITNDDIKKDYTSGKESMKILGLNRANFYKSVDLFEVKKIGSGNKTKYYKEDILFILKQQEELGTKYITGKLAREIYGQQIVNEVSSLQTEMLGFVQRTDIFEHKVRSLYDKVDLDKAVNSRNSLKDSSKNTDYITGKQAAKILGLNKPNFLKSVDLFETRKIGRGKLVEYYKEDILFILNQQEELGKRYISLMMAKEIYVEGIYQSVSPLPFPLPAFVKRKDRFNGYIKCLYDKDALDEAVYTCKNLKFTSNNVEYELCKEKLGLEIDRRDIAVKEGLIYVKSKVSCGFLNITYSTFIEGLRDDSNINVLNSLANYIYIDDLIRLKREQELFWEKHFDSEEVLKKYTKAFLSNNKCLTVNIPYYARVINSEKERNYKGAYLKEDINRLVNASKIERVHCEEDLKSNYISKEEAKKLLCLSECNFMGMVKEFDIKAVTYSSRKLFYPKDEIYFFKEQQYELGRKYISNKTVINEYGSTVAQNTPTFIAPYFARNNKIFEQRYVISLYDRDEVEKRAKNLMYRKQFSDITIEGDPYGAFLKKLALIEGYSELNETAYTKEKWYSYVANSLATYNRNEQGMDVYVNIFVELSTSLEAYLKEYDYAEIYTLSTNQLQELINSCSSVAKKYEFYKFAAEINKDLEIKKELNNIEQRFGFNYSAIEKPRNTNMEKSDKKPLELLSFEEWKVFFKFITDINYHVKEVLNENFDSKNRIKYLSTWLYLALHTNNSWRHTNVTMFPRIYLTDLCDEYEINSLGWFVRNEIPLELARIVLARVYRYELRVMKTDVKANFFCSDDLTIPFATILLMFEICYKYDYIGECNNYNSPVMKFFTKYNTPHNKGIKSFINNYEGININFGSKKINKSIMDIINRVSNGLDLPAYMRSHINKHSTLHYMNITQKDLDFLSENLFARGEFGYIYDTLLDIKNGNIEVKLKEKTDEIVKIKKNFGDEIKIEATLGVVNYFVNERYELLNMISQKGMDFALETLNDIYLEKYPSKQDCVQCLYSKKGCVNIDEDKCIDCKYSIPTIYAVNTICQALKEDLIKYNKSTSPPQRIRLSAKIQRKKQLLKECIDSYGRDFVYNLLEISSDEFKLILSGVERVDDLYLKL